jgi:hypothetical protein
MRAIFTTSNLENYELAVSYLAFISATSKLDDQGFSQNMETMTNRGSSKNMS